MRILWFFMLLPVLAMAQDRGFVQKRRDARDHVALVIGNSRYPDAPLTNPANDAADVAAAFREIGFITELVLDADREQMAKAVSSFSQKLRTAKAAVFYYAGHGMQVEGQNYLIPIGNTEATQITKEEQVPFRAYNVSEVLAAMEAAQVNFSMVVLDACRNNPLRGGGRGKIPGLAQIDAPLGSLVMYATKAGAIASDGTNSRNSPFTTAFLQHLRTPGLDVNLLPSKITATVGELTSGQQVPGTYMQLKQSFTFVPVDMLDDIHMAKSKELEELQAKQAEIDELDKKIAQLKRGSAPSEGDLQQILAYAREKKAREEEISRIKKEKYVNNNIQIEKDLQDYREIASIDRESAVLAWNVILRKWNLPDGSVSMGDEAGLKRKANPVDLPRNFTETVNGVSFTMIRVQGGSFQMGSRDGEADEKPVHEVRLSDYYLCEVEVTQRLWRAVMGSNPSKYQNCDECPVENVSYDDIVNEFLPKLSRLTGKTYRLPTEAQWEYAARGGNESRGYKYSGSDDVSEVAWYGYNSGFQTHPVRTKAPNELGLYDMSGNVYEWCSDWYDENYYASSGGSRDPQGPFSGSTRVLRGGGWYRTAQYCRAATRFTYDPRDRAYFNGLRVAAPAPPR